MDTKWRKAGWWSVGSHRSVSPHGKLSIPDDSRSLDHVCRTDKTHYDGRPGIDQDFTTLELALVR